MYMYVCMYVWKTVNTEEEKNQVKQYQDETFNSVLTAW